MRARTYVVSGAGDNVGGINPCNAKHPVMVTDEIVDWPEVWEAEDGAVGGVGAPRCNVVAGGADGDRMDAAGTPAGRGRGEVTVGARRQGMVAILARKQVELDERVALGAHEHMLLVQPLARKAFIKVPADGELALLPRTRHVIQQLGPCIIQEPLPAHNAQASFQALVPDHGGSATVEQVEVEEVVM
jgi:hypothetical protein